MRQANQNWGRAARALLFAALVFLPAPVAQGGEAELHQAVQRLLESGWEGTFSSRREADERFANLPSTLRGEAQARYAYALVKVKQRRYPEALQDASELARPETADVAAIRMRLWLLVLLKDYDAALVEASRVAAAIEAKGDDASQAAAQLQHSRFLGRLFGFMEGPAADAVSAAARERHERSVLTKLSVARQAAFEEGRSAVLDQFLDFTKEKEETRREALVDEEAARQRTLREVEATREDIKLRDEELRGQDDKLRGERTAEVKKLESEDSPLANELSRLGARATVVNRELAVLTGDIVDLQARARREKESDRRRFLLRQASRLSLLASRYDADLLALERQAAVIAAKRAQLRQKRQQVETRYDQELKRIAQERSALRKRLRRADIDEKNAAKPNTGNTRRVRALSAQAQALTTYDPFPLEEERKRLLEALKR